MKHCCKDMMRPRVLGIHQRLKLIGEHAKLLTAVARSHFGTEEPILRDG